MRQLVYDDEYYSQSGAGEELVCFNHFLFPTDENRIIIQPSTAYRLNIIL